MTCTDNAVWELAFKYEHQMTKHKKLWILLFYIIENVNTLCEIWKKNYLTISETREMSSVSHTENANVTDRKQLPFRDNI